MRKNNLFVKIAYIIVALTILITWLGCSSIKSKRINNEYYSSKIDSLIKLKNTVKIDSFVIYKDRTIIDVIETEVEVPIECDSLGNVQDFSYSTKTSKSYFKTTIKNNKLKFSLKLDSIVKSIESKYYSQYKKDSVFLEKKYLEKLKEKKSVEIDRKENPIIKNLKIIGVILFLLLLIYFLLKKRILGFFKINQ